MNKKRFWFLAYPDIPKPIGGIKQIHRVAELLESLGFQSCLVQERASFHPQWFESSVRTISREEWKETQNNLNPKIDLIVIAETFLPIISSLPQSIPVIVFNQNSSYTFGLSDSSRFDIEKTIKLYSHQSIAQIWCVSEYDRRFLNGSVNVPSNKVVLIKNPIELVPHTSFPKKKKQITYMPRKNKYHSSVVTSLLRQQSWCSDFDFIPIQNFTHQAVLNHLRDSLLFLSFGHPEGFGLPLAEALVSCCAVVGYSGLGGRELINVAVNANTAGVVEYGDFNGFIDQTFMILSFMNQDFPDFATRALQVSQRIGDEYSMQSFHYSLSRAVSQL